MSSCYESFGANKYSVTEQSDRTEEQRMGEAPLEEEKIVSDITQVFLPFASLHLCVRVRVQVFN